MPAFLSNPMLIVALASVGAFAAIVAFGLPFVQRDTFQSRLKAVAKRRQELSKLQKAQLEKKSLLRRPQESFAKRVIQKLKLENLTGSPAVRAKLAQAGLRGQAPVYTFVFARLALPLVLVAVAALFVFVLKPSALELPAKLLVVGGAALIGYYLPKMVVANKAKKRQADLVKALPDALDLMVICVEAGLSMEATFTRVAEEMADSAPILAEELGLTTAELAFLGERRQALENLATRTGLPTIKGLTTALIQSEKYGTPLGTTLRVIAEENRDERMARAEQRAGALPAMLTVPMILFFMPVLFIVLIGPTIIQTIRGFGS